MFRRGLLELIGGIETKKTHEFLLERNAMGLESAGVESAIAA